MENALSKFLRYVKIDTQSMEDSPTFPSTQKQFDLANLLVQELKELGIENAYVDEYCYVYANIDSNLPPEHPNYNKVPPIAFIAHLDTSPEVSGKDVKPQVIENYQGGDIVLTADETVVIKESENPKLKECIGHTIVTTDGTTLLGADNKAGITAIMCFVEHLVNNPQILHGDIRICFTPDEEVGQGTKYINLEKLNAKYAYTVDGEFPGELNKETFSANSATIKVTGRDIHPGSAKNIMVNAVRIISDIISKMPKNMAPETTEGYEPYIHPHSLEGKVSNAVVKILLRDFKTEGLEVQKQILEKIIEEVQNDYPKAKIELEIKESYRNMYEKLIEHPIVLDNLWEAVKRTGIEPYWKPIRGGTDGAKLTEKGLPTPNIYTGSTNFHSKTEWLSVQALEKTIETLVNLVQIWTENPIEKK